MPLPNSIIATLSPNSSRQVTFIFTLHGWTQKHPAPDGFPAVVHLISVCDHTAPCAYWDCDDPERAYGNGKLDFTLEGEKLLATGF